MQSHRGYRLLPRYSYEAEGLLLRPVEPSDIESIRLWRNAQMEVLRQSHEITTEQQEAYYKEQIWPGKSRIRPNEILFSIELDDVLVGYGGLVHIDWDMGIAEVSFLLDPSLERQLASKRGILIGFVKILRRVAFHNLGFKEIWTETFNFRREHIAMLEAAGFESKPVVGGSPHRISREDSEKHTLSAKW